jgi:excisionase family DNA binding protein
MGNPYNDVALYYAAQERARKRTMTRRELIEDDLEQEWYTVPEAAEELGEHPKTLYRRIRNGEIKADKRRPRKTRIHYTDLAAYMSLPVKRDS